MPLGAVPVLSWCGEVSLGGKQSSRASLQPRRISPTRRVYPFWFSLTRYCLTSKLYCGSPTSFYCPPPHLQSLPYCNTIARPLLNIRPPPTPLLYAIHHTILVMAILCKGQVLVSPSGHALPPPLSSALSSLLKCRPIYGSAFLLIIHSRHTLHKLRTFPLHHFVLALTRYCHHQYYMVHGI